MTYAELFSKVKGMLVEADVSGIKEHLAFQFNITGEGAGAFYVEVRDGRAIVEPYEYHDRDVLFTCSAATLEKLASGKLDPILAVTLQKLKVEGNIEKALQFKELLKKHR